MIICTAATRNSVYEPLLEIQSKFYGDKIHTSLFPKMRWGEGTKIKPQAIRAALQHDEYVLWMDSDCRVDLPNSPPEGDYSVCVFDNINPEHINRISAAYILFRRSMGADRFLIQWEKNNQFVKKDHPALTQTILQMQDKIKIVNKTEWLQGRQVLNALLPERGLYK